MPKCSLPSSNKAMRSHIPLAALAVLLLSQPPATAAPRTHEVIIDKMKFGSPPEGLHAGDSIVWVNKDLVRHTATSKAGGFDLDLPPGTRKASTVRKAGDLAVACRYHPGMRVMLKVKP